MKFSENKLQLFSAPLSATEDQQCKNAIGMVRDALKELGLTEDAKGITRLYEDTYSYSVNMRSISGRNVKIFIQGSYANNTNVRTQSDVDIAVVQEETFQAQYRPGITHENYGFITESFVKKLSFKDEVQKCLSDEFGMDVERKNKSIKVHGNTYRKDADTVPCRRNRDYRNDSNFDANNYIAGVMIFADDGTTIINYPEQHIANGKKKNVDTSYQYKKMVRIIKNMRYLMEENYCSDVKNVSSFGLESLLWNIPNNIFRIYSSVLRYTFDEVVKYLFNHRQDINFYKEANGIKPLCPSITDTEKYLKFVESLSKFYEFDI